jgi:RND family efflux transporter MFP subunit
VTTPPKILTIAACVASAFLTSSCNRGEVAAAEAPSLSTVAVVPVQTRDLSRDIVLTAEFKPFQEVDVMAKVAGYVKSIDVDIGDRVREGQLLATLEVPEMGDDLRRATAAIDRSQAEVQRARDELRRAESAHQLAHVWSTRVSSVKPGLVAQQEIDDARSKDLVAEAQVSSAQSALSAAQEQVSVNQADAARIKTLMAYTLVTAPFSGVITKRFADKGSMIQAGTASQTQAMPLVRLSQNGLLRLILPVPESAVPSVRIGERVTVRVPSLDRTFPGTVARIEDRLALETRTMDAEVDVPNADLVLIPGMYAEVDLTLATRNSVLAVPVTAVDITADNSGRVMLVSPTGRLEVRQVELGLETPSLIEIRSGLNDGDLVVTASRSSLQPGQQVHTKVMAVENTFKP